jgi:hypothetical protein
MLGTYENNLIIHLIEAYNDEHGHEKPPNFLRNKDRKAKRRGVGRGILVKFGTLPRTLHSLIIRMIELIFTLLWLV